ncbi:MAG: 2-dehydropantoate 2-reductase [Burkholderiaceae bacterium]
MKVLILGAGATGGYYGGRCAAAGADVSFIVRPSRAALLAERGLRITSPKGDVAIQPQLIVAGQPLPQADLIILSCKAYDLDSAIESIRPAVGPQTTVMPLLNGISHYDRLDAAFGAPRVLGGLCQIPVTVGDQGQIVHMGPFHSLTYGERDGSESERCRRIGELFAPAGFDAQFSRTINLALWEKFTFLTTLASINCLMRGNIGQILRAQDGAALIIELLDECQAVAAAAGHPIPPEVDARVRATLTTADSPVTASMMRDLEQGLRIEAQQITGDMLRRARDAGIAAPLLRVAYAHLQTYQARQAAR